MGLPHGPVGGETLRLSGRVVEFMGKADKALHHQSVSLSLEMVSNLSFFSETIHVTKLTSF